MSIKRFLVIPHLKIHNANAMSSPYTIGFPAMTAWLGAVHALERKIHERSISDLSKVRFLSAAISCHDFNLQTYKGENDYVSSIVGTSNPLDKDGNRPAFIEEARCHLEVTLLIEMCGLDPDHDATLLENVMTLCRTMKFASGDLLGVREPKCVTFDEDDDAPYQHLTRHLMPGNLLIERRDLMIEEMRQGANALDAMLSHLKIMHRCTKDDDKGKVAWTNSKKTKGWIVPISVGFQGISSLSTAAEQRDPEIPHRFAEAVLTLGEFVMAHKLGSDYFLDDILWSYKTDIENDLYLCQTQCIKSLITL